MIGKRFPQLIRYTVIGGVILIVGTQLLASVIEVVIALRFGDFLPFLSVVTIAVLLMRLTMNMETETPLHVLLNLLAWIATGYLMVLAFMLVLPFGLVASLIASGITAVALEQLRNPFDMQRSFRSMSLFVAPFSSTIVSAIASKAVNSKKFTDGISVWLIPHKHSPLIAQLIQTRPLLPIALTHLLDKDILVIRENKNTPTTRNILNLLKANEVPRLERASSILSRVILNLPLIEQEILGLPMQDYCIIHDERTLEMVLSKWPIGGTLFSSAEGSMMIVRSDSVVGFNSTKIPKGLEPWVLVKHDMSMLNLAEG